MNLRPSGYEPDELPGCSTPRVGLGCGEVLAFVCGFRLGGPGGDRLSHVLRRSTMGAEGFHGRVRDGIGWGTLAMTTRSSKQKGCGAVPLWRALDPPVVWLWLWRSWRRVCRCVRGCLSLSKPFERLGPVSCACCHASTPGLSTWWSSTALKGDLVSRKVSRLDAFSGYPVRT